ncbi:hypothetical protein J4N45_23405 [Vibrio sp. SCSIO 43140]|nr:hypothetical protein [Vibrio sp. SCSIO 43140]USD62324.1 hypothetical protein J4N45_23405 [Vibrio sp. SCSIO 43140]
MSLFTYARDSKYYSTHKSDADTRKCMDCMKELIHEHAQHFSGLPYEAAIAGELNGSVFVSKGELEEKEPPIGEPMGCRSDYDRDGLKRYVLLYVDKCVRMYNGASSSLINSAYASIVEAMFEMQYITFEEAEDLLAETLKDNA